MILEDLPRPEPTPGQVLIEVRAFGLNRSEWFTRIGDSPSVRLPRVLGIECVGTVVSAPGGEFDSGQKVCAIMGGLGREFDGSYAEYTGLTTLAMAKSNGLRVLTTSRSAAKADVLKEAGADEVLIDDGSLIEKVRQLYPEGVDRVLELIGTNLPACV